MNEMKRKGVLLRLRPEHHTAFKEKAVARDMPLTKWIIQACLAYQAKGARFSKRTPKEYGPCGHCGMKHNPKEHFSRE